MAKLYFRYGAMGCGKTMQLLQVAFNYEERGHKVCVIKPKTDTKNGSKLLTRIGPERETNFCFDKKTDLYKEVLKNYDDVHCVLVDEAQFLTEKQVNQLMDVVIDLDIPVMCFGLRTDFLGNSFPGARRLLDISHELSEIKTICECGHKAMFNVRLIDGKVQTEGDSVAIDGEEKVTYTVACARCFRLKTHRKFDNTK